MLLVFNTVLSMYEINDIYCPLFHRPHSAFLVLDKVLVLIVKTGCALKVTGIMSIAK